MKLQNKFNLNFKFSKNIKYNFFPKPHFTIKILLILKMKMKFQKLVN